MWQNTLSMWYTQLVWVQRKHILTFCCVPFLLPVFGFFLHRILLTVALQSLLFTLNPFDSIQGRQTTHDGAYTQWHTFYSVCHLLYWIFICQSFMSFVTICGYILRMYWIRAHRTYHLIHIRACTVHVYIFHAVSLEEHKIHIHANNGRYGN